jgi:hypothetical protein
MKAWATRRQKQQDRMVALKRLIEVMDSIGGELVTRTPIQWSTLCQSVFTAQLINWRDRISSAIRILDAPGMQAPSGNSTVDQSKGSRDAE